MRTRWRLEPWEEVRWGERRGGVGGGTMAVMGVLWSCCGPSGDGIQVICT